MTLNFRLLGTEVAAMMVSYLMLSLPMAGATQINIIYGSTTRTVQFDQDDYIYRQVNIVRDPSDVAWSDVKVLFDISSANLAYTIKKIYLFKCKNLNAADCARTDPQVFDSWIDTEIAWNDIASQTGSSTYPQVANVFLLVKLEDVKSRVSWLGFWVRTTRTSYNTFNTLADDIQTVDAYANSADLVNPAAVFIENRLMIPYSWMSRVQFEDPETIGTLYALGASESEIEGPDFTASTLHTDKIEGPVSKFYYFVVPESGSKRFHPLLLNLNPSFDCGNGVCESDLGEDKTTCCYDCACGAGEYCSSTADSPESGVCASRGNISLSSVSASAPSLSGCSASFQANFTVSVQNPPKGMHATAQAILHLGGKDYSVTCARDGSSYVCPAVIDPPVRCGKDRFSISGNSINLTITYPSGGAQESMTLSGMLHELQVAYACGCGAGEYCDIGTHTCESEAAITLGIPEFDSYLSLYRPGDPIHLKARVFNPPTGLTLTGKTVNMTIRPGSMTIGNVECTGPDAAFEWDCLVNFQINGYSDANSYTLSPNVLYFSVTYRDADKAKTTTISSAFGPIGIPARSCGDGQCVMGETSANCCLDCPCEDPAQYCDRVQQCRNRDDIGLSLSNPSPSAFQDCREPHEVAIVATVNNAPTGFQLEYSNYLLNMEQPGWNLDCQDKVTPTTFRCKLAVPVLEEEDFCASPDPHQIGPNSLALGISYPNGLTEIDDKELTAGFAPLTLKPVFHCGDGECESSLGENQSSCCYDCGCGTDASGPGGESASFCNYDPRTFEGECMARSNITLHLDSVGPLSFDSCEITNELNINARIINQPKTANINYYFATINGTDTKDMTCDTTQAAEGEPFFLNCSIGIPPVSACTLGGAYAYDRNSVSLNIEYTGSPAISQTITANFSPILVSQKVTTLFDINSWFVREMRGRADQSMNIARQLLSSYEQCLDTAQTLMTMMFVLTIAATIGGLAFWGGSKMGWFGNGNAAPSNTPKDISSSSVVKSGGWQTAADPYLKAEGAEPYAKPSSTLSFAGTTDYTVGSQQNTVQRNPKDTGFTGSDFGSLINAVSTTAGKALDTYIKMCELVAKKYELALKVQQMEMEFLKMNYCIAVVQHSMDIGKCSGESATSCFSQTVNCVDFGQIDSSIDKVGNVISDASKISQDIGDNFQAIGSVWEKAKIDWPWSDPTGNVNIKCGTSMDAYCCNYEPRSYGYQPATLRVTIRDASCSNPTLSLYGVAASSDVAAQPTELLVKQGIQNGWSGTPEAFFGEQASGTYRIYLTCDGKRTTNYLEMMYCKGTPQAGCGPGAASCPAEFWSATSSLPYADITAPSNLVNSDGSTRAYAGVQYTFEATTPAGYTGSIQSYSWTTSCQTEDYNGQDRPTYQVTFKHPGASQKQCSVALTLTDANGKRWKSQEYTFNLYNRNPECYEQGLEVESMQDAISVKGTVSDDDKLDLQSGDTMTAAVQVKVPGKTTFTRSVPINANTGEWSNAVVIPDNKMNDQGQFTITVTDKSSKKTGGKSITYNVVYPAPPENTTPEISCS
jgi:hypothetical protein